MPNKSQSNAQTPCICQQLVYFDMLLCSPCKRADMRNFNPHSLASGVHVRPLSPLSSSRCFALFSVFLLIFWSVLFLNGLPFRFGCQFESVARCSRSSRLLLPHTHTLSLSAAHSHAHYLAHSLTRAHWLSPLLELQISWHCLALIKLRV